MQSVLGGTDRELEMKTGISWWKAMLATVKKVHIIIWEVFRKKSAIVFWKRKSVII
jgi:hypothetical protein